MSTEARKAWGRRIAVSHLTDAIHALEGGRPNPDMMPERFTHSYAVLLANAKALRRRIETWPVTETERDQLRAAEYSAKVARQREEAPR